MIGIDTNILLRIINDDDRAQSKRIRALLAPLDPIPQSVLINDVVLAETVWTLQSAYRWNKPEIVAALRLLAATATFAFEDRDILLSAISAYERSGAGFADSLIAAKNVAAGCDFTATFDRAMRLLPGAKVL
ncbi:MAG: PIN domain-containing protein [Gammaproteobacteria bacterium]